MERESTGRNPYITLMLSAGGGKKLLDLEQVLGVVVQYSAVNSRTNS